MQESGAGILQDSRAGRIRAPDRVIEETKVPSAGTVLILDRSLRALVVACGIGSSVIPRRLSSTNIYKLANLEIPGLECVRSSGSRRVQTTLKISWNSRELR
jgi:hypothetical protein